MLDAPLEIWIKYRSGVGGEFCIRGGPGQSECILETGEAGNVIERRGEENAKRETWEPTCWEIREARC